MAFRIVRTVDPPTKEQLAELVPDGLVFLGFRGSISHAMFTPSDHADSIDDKDLMGVYIAPVEHYFGFARTDVFERFVGEWDTVHYELRKMFALLLKNNPNVLSLLWLDPEYHIVTTPLWQRVVDHRDLFVSKLAYHSFTGYAHGQLKKMTAFGEEQKAHFHRIEDELRARGIELEWATKVNPLDVSPTASERSDGDEFARMNRRDIIGHFQKMRRQFFAGYQGDKRRKLVERNGYDTKNAAHCIRLLRMGTEFLETGALQVVREDAEELLTIKYGGWTLDQVKAEAERLFKRAEEAYDRCTLPHEPDRERAEQLLVEILREHFSHA